MSTEPYIPVAKPKMPKALGLLPFLLEIDQTGIYSNFGPLNSRLETLLSNHLGICVDQISTASNATTAITGLLRTSGITHDSVTTPSWTFTATPAAILQAGYSVEFVDVNLDTWEPDSKSPDEAEVHVLPFGGSGDPQLNSRKIKSNIPLIIDAAASFANLNAINLPKNRDWAVVVSLHATKLLGSGEGAFVYSNNESWIREFKTWCNFGFWGTRSSQIQGANAKLSEYHAAVGLASLQAWPETLTHLQTLTSKCREISKQAGFLCHPAMEAEQVTPYWILKLENSSQKSTLKELLQFNNIGYRDWWGEGAHLMPAYSSQLSQLMPNTREISTTTIGLPFFSALREFDTDRISRVINQLRKETKYSN